VQVALSDDAREIGTVPAVPAAAPPTAEGASRDAVSTVRATVLRSMVASLH
jgi:hypothetical protein